MPEAQNIPRMLEAAALADIGTQRNHMEDEAAAVEELGLCVVADGMGGQHTGDEASELTAKTIIECLQTKHTVGMTGPDWQRHMLVEAIRLANVRVVNASHTSHNGHYTLHARGLGCTVAAAVGVAGGVLIAHVGDCRCYRWRRGALELLTEDHTLVNEYRKTNALTPEQIAQIPANIITRGLGRVEPPEVDVRFEPLVEGDVYVLCTDGLTGALPDDAIAAALRVERPLSEACRSLIEEANARGTPDNLSVALARWGT